MRDPNSERFRNWTLLMATGQFVGQDAPVTRVSMCKIPQRQLTSTRGQWRSLLGNPYGYQAGTKKLDVGEMEFGNLLSVEITRTLGQDAATCVIQTYNIWGTSEDPEGADTLLRPGYLTYDRGNKHTVTRSLYDSNFDPSLHNALPGKTFPTDWGYARNLWNDFLIPNTVVRTWQGYGTDSTGYVHDPPGGGPENSHYVAPWDDTQLVCTGTWLIDRVTFGADYTVQIECRDIGKLLLEQYIYPPMLPMSRFPLIYCPDVADQGSVAIKKGKNTVRAISGGADDKYNGFNGSVYGHRPSDAIDSKPGTFWLSVGNAVPNADWSYEWIQTNCGGDTINYVGLNLIGNNYRIYVSVFENGAWQGGATIPYNGADAPFWDNDAAIPYVVSVTSGSASSLNIHLGRGFKAEHVRVTFTNLWNSGLAGSNPSYIYRAGVREMSTYYQTGGNFVAGTVGKPGYIHDWMDVVKELACWAGFTWVGAPSADPLIGVTPNIATKYGWGNKKLRVWGDIESTVGPIVCTNADYFVNKSFMDGIKQIADFLGNIVMVDESGGLICRQPNIWAIGNFIDDPDASPGEKAYVTGNYIEFHENANLITYQSIIDDTDVRSEIEVIGMYPGTSASAVPIAGGTTLDGKVSAIDFTNVLAGQQRLFIVPGDASSLLSKPIECQRMAELTALAILMNYRKGSIHAPLHPGLQIDDQVRIYERTTNENNLHYVSGIHSLHNLVTGECFMDVDTHWLGTDPKGAGDWFTNKIKLTPAVTQLPAIIARINKYGTDNRGEQQPPYNFAGSTAGGIPPGYGYGQNPLPS